MPGADEIRANEVTTVLPDQTDAGLIFIGRIRTPWTSRADCPKQGSISGPICHIEVFTPWLQALSGFEADSRLEILYWLDKSRRDLVMQSPGNDGKTRGTFTIRSPVRPNPIGLSRVLLVELHALGMSVRGLDCLDGTPLIDIKPDRCPFAPS